mgnify:CR=1 FL=1
MPWTKEQQSEYHRQYRIKNREKIAEYNKQYRIDNAEYHSQYQQTPKGKKIHRISDWKRSGLIDSDNDNYESIYNHYISTQKCENCDVDLTEDKKTTSTTKCMDHSHITGEFRNILCCACNSRRQEDKF